MKRALIALTLSAAALLVVATSTADAGIHVRWGWGGYGCRYPHVGRYAYRPRFGVGYGYYGYASSYYYSPYRSYYYHPRTSIYYSAPYYRSYYYGYPSYYYGGYGYPSYYYRGYGYPSYYYRGYGCASTEPGGFSPSVVVAPAAPIYADAGAAYGPDAVKQFFGLDRDFAKGPLAPRSLVVNAAPVDEASKFVAVPAEAEAKEERVASNAQARARADRFVSFGDERFGEQQYHSAAQRYRFAMEAAPDVASAYFRQGFAYIASNRYDLAVEDFRRGLALDPLWVNTSFRINDLYGRNGLAKNAHLDALAQAALVDRGNPDLYFLVGVMLHFDGQPERAKKFFQRAEQLTGDDADHIDAFLLPPTPRPEDAV